jgi:hypothetical protein
MNSFLIELFSRYECGDMIQSEEFPPYDLQKESWTLRLYPKGHQRLSKEGINGASSTDDDSTIQFYLTLCPSHIASQNSSASNQAVTSHQLQVYFRVLINFSNPQVNIRINSTYRIFQKRVQKPIFSTIKGK